MRLRALAPAKVNLSLFLGPAQADGRHELVTLLESVSLADELALTVLADHVGADRVICPGVEGENLVSSALAGLRQCGWDPPPVRIEVVKRIPIAAGMGGGSADAAAALRMAAELEPVPRAVLTALAAALGADVPSQLAPGLALGTGAGDLVEPLSPLAPHAFAVLPQPQPLATAAVYREADRLNLPRGTAELQARREQLVRALAPGATLDGALITNDLQDAAVSLCPAITAALLALREAGADDRLVCGSGPTVAGVFWGEDASGRAAAAATSLAGRFPGAASALPVAGEFGLPRSV